ncbi:hypothetical protein CDD80_2338 [Ophiocordyceps camponoti-rufipedis]|uniref:BRCT domain-containing protein n=1 Tax=Ophiocordyceps camponoti-rufipedis TaxID=2004952 RepID=A0A2C5Z7Z1_9HYPO|nr:hypothetical protein CDD80_2338 [Ophiocordyceps camponoti-rufipedis]
MPRRIFQDRVIAAAGPLPGQLTTENLRRWIEARRGRFVEEVDSTVTHLLCTSEQFEKRVPRVKQGLALGKSCHVVHHDWFEFSIAALREKRLPEGEFLMRKRENKLKAKIRDRARHERGMREGERFVNTNFFHIYTDREMFSYRIILTRPNEDNNDEQRYELCLWESNAKPHLYQFTAKFLKRKGDSQPSYHRPSPCSAKWRGEMNLFMAFFRLKTGIDWQDRVLGEKTMPPSFFSYSPPVSLEPDEAVVVVGVAYAFQTGGKPVGRRLRFDYDYCREINAEIRGLPLPDVSSAVETCDKLFGDDDFDSLFDEEDDDSLCGEGGDGHDGELEAEALDAKA